MFVGWLKLAPASTVSSSLFLFLFLLHVSHQIKPLDFPPSNLDSFIFNKIRFTLRPS